MREKNLWHEGFTLNTPYTRMQDLSAINVIIVSQTQETHPAECLLNIAFSLSSLALYIDSSSISSCKNHRINELERVCK